MTTVERIELELNKKGIKAAKMSKDLGFSSGLFSQWKSGAQKPSASSLEKVAKYFNVSIDYLKGNNEQSIEDIVKTYLFGTTDTDDFMLVQVKQYANYLYKRKEALINMDNNQICREPYSYVREVFADKFLILDYIISKTNLPQERKLEIRENGEVNEEEFNIIQTVAEEEMFIYDLWQLLRPTFERKLDSLVKDDNSNVYNAARNGSEPNVDSISNEYINELEEKTKSQNY